MPRLAAALLLTVALGGCGFHLKDTVSLPFAPVYVEGGGAIRDPLRTDIRYAGKHQLADSADQAAAILQILSETDEQRILTIDAAGRVAEYRLIYRVSFRVHDRKGTQLLAPQTIELSRDLTYSDSQVLSKGLESQLLYKDMSEDAAEQIMRRMSVIRPAP